MKRKFVLALLASMAIGNAWATEPFRVHRWESFYGLPVTTGNTVFVGNSITNMHDWWEAFGDNHSILNRGTSGGFTYEVLDHLEMIIAGKPAKLFLGIGTNDITAYTPETVADNIRIIAERIINESPSTQIYVQSVLPSTSGNRNQRNPELNRQIEAKVNALKAKYPDAKLEYVNVFDLFVAGDGYSIKSHNGLSLAYDALHPTVLGYGLWCHEIAGRVGSNCIYDTNVTEMFNGGQNNSTGDRITCFAQQVVEEDDVLIIGDEMVSSGEWHEWLKSGNVKNRGLGWGYTGSSLNQLVTNAPIYFKNSKSVAPKAIVVYAGVDESRTYNNHPAWTAEAFKSKCLELVSKLREQAPNTKIYFLTPLNTPTASENTLLAQYKTQLEAIAAADNTVKVIDATSMNGESKYFYKGDGGNYLTSFGYAKVAQTIASALKADGLNFEAVSDEECAQNKALYTNRDLVGDALTAALRLQGKEGNGMGQYSDLSALNAPLQAAYTLLASGEITEADATSAKTALSVALPEINQPTSGKYYTLCSVNRGSKYLTSDGTNVVGTGDANYAKNQWQFVARDNGTFDLINRADNKYLSTAAYDQALTVSTTVPENGWAFTGSNSAGLYNVANGTCEINMTTSKFNNLDGIMKVVNWSKSKNGDDRADLGCQFQILEVEGEPDILPDTPEHGKVFTIYNDHAGTPYYLANTTANADSKTDLTTTLATDGSEKWIVWGDTQNGYELINVANGAKVTSHNNKTSFDVDNIKVKLGISLIEHGTQAHIAGNTKNLSLSGGIFTKKTGNDAVYNEFTNANGSYSTDFVFFSTGENAYKVQGGNVTVAGQAYTNGQFIVTESTLTVSDVIVTETGKTARISNNIISVVDEVAPVVYTIANYVKNPETTRYLKNENGTLKLVEANTLDASDSKFQWTLREDGTNYDIVSVADGKVLDYSKGLSDNGTPFAKSEGTTSDYTALYNSVMGGGRYLAASADGNHFGTTSGQGYYAQNKVQTNGWSTDFIFTEIPVVPGQPEGTAVNLGFSDGALSGGSTNWRTTWTSSATPAVKVEAINKNDLVGNFPGAQASNENFIVYTGNRNTDGITGGYSSYLRVSAPTGYYITGYEFEVTKYDGSKTEIVSLRTPKNTEGYSIATTDDVFSESYTFAANSETTTFDFTLVGANKGIKFSNFKVYVKEVSNQPTTYTISSTTGTLYHSNGNANQSYNAVWKSSKTPQLQFGCGVNNMRYSGTNLELMTGSSGNATYTISAPAGYVITGYSFNYANNNHDTALNFTHNGAETQTTRTPQRISVEGVEVKNASFTIEGDNSRGLVLTEFTVTIEPFVAKPPVESTKDNEKWYYIVNASSKDYCRDKVMYYEPDGNRMKFADKAFDARYIWSFWRGDNGKLAIKNYKGEYIGTAGSGQGGNTAFGMSDEPNYIYSIDPSNGFLTIGDGALPLHAQQSGSLIVRWAAEADGASLWRFEKADITHADATLSTTLVQQGKISTGRGNKNVPIIRSTMKVSGLEGSVTFSGVKGKVTGTNLADITKVQAYFATDNRELHVADSRMEWRNSNAVLYGTAASIGADGQFTITGENKTLEPGNYYLWLTLDVAENATEGNKVDAQITGYTIDGAEAPEANGNPQYEATVLLSEGTVLMAGDGKFGSKYFRIPAITTTADGKRLVTLTDDRLNHNGDLPSHVYITAQYSDDNGQTWSEPKIVAGEAETGGDYAHGDAQIITNRVNGDIVGIMTCATNGQGFWGSSPERPQTWKTIISHDNGETWTVPVDHTKELYAAGSPNPLWKGGFSGSGAGLQKRDGTLVSPFVNRDENGKRQFVLFESVDAGESWHVAGNPCMINEADEPKVLERNNGDLAISVRATGRNFHNETSDNGLTWNHPVNTRFTTGISGNACDGEYMVWCSTLDGNERNIAFQTVPNNGSRQNVSIALSLDEGDTFEAPKTICPRGSAYSAATVLADGTLGVYYEENGVNDGYTMRFVRFSLDWASDHKYGFTAEKPFKRYTSLQAIVNAILRNIYQSATISNATDEIKRLNEVQR